MTRHPMARWLALVAALLVTAACASAAREGVTDDVRVRVNNNVLPPTSLTVWMVPQTGTREMIGSVNPADTAVFTLDLGVLPERYVFLARTTAGSEIQSNPFTLTAGSAVSWDIAMNAVTFP